MSSITFLPNEKIFSLNGENYSYVMQIKDGYLRHLYYGEKIANEDISSLFPQFLRAFSTNNFINDSFDTFSNEFPTLGKGDFRNFAFLIKTDTGSRLTDFKYEHHEIIDKPKETILPNLKGGKTLVIYLKDAISNIELNLYYTPYDKGVVRSARIKNMANTAVYIKKISSFSLDIPNNNYELVYLSGSYARERQIETTPLKPGLFEISSLRGTSSHQFNPFIAIKEKHTTEFSGNVYGFNLVYGGSFSLSAYTDQYDYVRLMGGINHADFSWQLNPKETFITPEVVLVFSNQGMNLLSQHFHDLYRDNLIKKTKLPIVFNSWESVYFDFDEEKLLSLIDKSALLGIEIFVLDDGWFGNRNDDTTSLGDWYTNIKKLPNGLKPLINRCKKHNMGFGLWIEPEMISPISELYQKHPNWVLRDSRHEPIQARNQYVLDLTNKEVIDYLKNTITKLLTENDISYVKWDMNRSLTENCSLTLDADNMEETHHRYMLGVYELLQYITDKFPHILFEGSSGGGGRVDPGMLRYFPQIWTSDNNDPISRSKIIYGTSLCYPLSTISNHIGDEITHANGRQTPLEIRTKINTLGPTGIEFNILNQDLSILEKVKTKFTDYKIWRNLIIDGDLYRLENPFQGDIFSFLIINREKTKGHLVILSSNITTNDKTYHTKLKGLNPKKQYLINNEKFFGSTLMNVGIPFRHSFGNYMVKSYYLEETL